MKERHVKKALLAGGALGTVLFCLAPFLLMLLTSLSEHPDFLGPAGHFQATTDHLRTVLTAGQLHFLAYLRNSLVIAGLSAVISVAIASLAAYALTRLPLPGKTLLLMVVLTLSMFPPVSLLGLLFRLFATLGWIDSYQALVVPYIAWTLPLSLWILVSYFSQIPRDLDRAALTDGCSRLQALRHVVLPVASPGLLSTTLLAFIFAFNEFLFALVLTTDHRARTLPVGIAQFEGLHGQVPWGQIMAAASLATLPVVILTLFFQRRIIQGLSRGAIKG